METPGKYLTGWIGGADSSLPPWLLPDNKVAWAENVMMRGGIIQTRPGFCLVNTFDQVSFPKRCQGFHIFKPKGLALRMLLVVDGELYVAATPFTAWSKVTGVKLVATAEIVVFQDTIKSVQRGGDGSLKIIAPKPVVIIQDGISNPISYDGLHARHLNPGAVYKETPIGLWMAWAEDRIWVANGSQVFVGDIGDPEGFTENTYLADRSGFALPDLCTGLLETADQQNLLAFTGETTTAFKSYIRDRETWAKTADFQRIILPNHGCTSGRSTLNQGGISYWFSQLGWVGLDTASYSLHTSKITSSDAAMQRSKTYLAADKSRIAAAAIENLTFISVPAGDTYNSHTWVMDRAILAENNAAAPDAWLGVWTGLRPVQWAKCILNGRQRLYCASFDYSALGDSNIHIWEAMRPTRRDDNNPILSQVETGMVRDVTMIDFKYAEIDIVELLGEVTLRGYLGGIKGPWHQVLEVTLQAEEGSLGSVNQLILEEDSILQAYKPQARTIRTEEWTPQDKARMIESRFTPGTDKALQLLLQWEGRMGIAGIRIVTAQNTSENMVGRCEPSETGPNILTERGETILV